MGPPANPWVVTDCFASASDIGLYYRLGLAVDVGSLSARGQLAYTVTLNASGAQFAVSRPA